VITAIDTNILIDIFMADKIFGKRSAEALRRCIQEGSLCANEVVWTEAATVFPNHEEFIKSMDTLGIEFSPILQETALVASNAWREYRKSGGKRERVVADFLIGAHATIQCERLLTRDRGLYPNCFKSLVVIDPSIKQ
jgi:predicted nucleic acid-binding protein